MKTTYMNLMISILFFPPTSGDWLLPPKKIEFLNFYFASWPYSPVKKRLLESGADRPIPAPSKSMGKPIMVSVWTIYEHPSVVEKGNECNQYKSSAAIFSSSLPICPVHFELVMHRHVLSPCYAGYEHTRGIKGYVTYYLACYVRLQVQNMPYYMRLRVQNMPGCHLRKYGWCKWADWRKKWLQHFCTKLISFGLFNVFRQWWPTWSGMKSKGRLLFAWVA